MAANSKKAVDVSVDAKQFVRVLKQAKEFDKKLYTKLRRDLRKAGADAAEDVRAEVRKPPRRLVTKKRLGGILSKTTIEEGTKTKISRHDLREHIAKGVKISISASPSARRVGVFINSKGSDEASKLLKKQWDKPKGFRHPVFAHANTPRDKWVWTAQVGRPYFGSVISKKQPAIQRQVSEILDSTLKDVEIHK